MVKRKFLTRLIIICIGLGTSLPSYADRYKRVVPFVDDRNVPISLPKNKTVCQDYLKLLNYHARKNVPLSCERPIPPGWTNFTKPEWEEIPLKENEDLLKKIDRFYRSYRYFSDVYEKDFDEEKWLKRINSFLDSGSAHLYKTEIDLNGDGQPETLIKYVIEPFCEPRRGAPERARSNTFVSVIDRTDPRGIRFLPGRDILFYQGELVSSQIDGYGDIYLAEAVNKAYDAYDILYKLGETIQPNWNPSKSFDKLGFSEVCKFSFSRSK